MRTIQTSRRVLLAGAGVAGLAAATGCAVYGDENLAPPPPAAPAGPGATDGAVAELASVSDVPVGGGTVLRDQQLVITQPTEGTFACFAAVCTHQGCLVSEVSNGTINCPCHGSRFNVADGSVAAGPAPSPLPRVDITVDGGTIRRT